MQIRKGTKKFQRIVDNATNIIFSGGHIEVDGAELTRRLSDFFGNDYTKVFCISPGKYRAFCFFTICNFDSVSA